MSTPYSISRTGWYGHRVCDVKVVVEGPIHKLEDVKKVIGGLDKFTTIKCEDKEYDGDDESELRQHDRIYYAGSQI